MSRPITFVIQLHKLISSSISHSAPVTDDDLPATIDLDANNTWHNPIHHNSNRPQNRRRSKPSTPSSGCSCIDILRSKLFLSVIIVSAVIITLLCIGLVVLYDQTDDIAFSADEWKRNLSTEQAIWYESGLNELKQALRMQINKKRARNIILFVGDGMGPNTVTASRIYKYGEDGHLSWERFPHMGLLKVSKALI